MDAFESWYWNEKFRSSVKYMAILLKYYRKKIILRYLLNDLYNIIFIYWVNDYYKGVEYKKVYVIGKVPEAYTHFPGTINDVKDVKVDFGSGNLLDAIV